MSAFAQGAGPASSARGSQVVTPDCTVNPDYILARRLGGVLGPIDRGMKLDCYRQTIVYTDR
jgi:hypothetical protein